MNRRTLLNLALAILVVVLGLVAWLHPGHTPAPAQPALITLKTPNIHSLRIRKGDDSLSLQRQSDGSWEMTAPRHIKADEFLINALLGSLSTPTLSHFKAVAGKLDQYGLKKPALTLWVNQTQVDFGNTEPLEGHHYVKVGDTVYLTTGTLYYRLNHDTFWWMDKALLPADAHITALQLPHATLTQVKGKWQLAPANPAISADAIQKLVDAWHDARALSVAAPEKAKSAGEVAIWIAGRKQPLRFAILDSPSYLLLVRPDLKLEYRLEKSQADSLLKFETTTPKKKASGHNGAKETPHAGTAGSRDHPPRH